jgi:antitoxin MazE
MRTRVQKWGNSLAVRIPKSLASEAHLGQDSEVEMSLVDDRIVLVAVPVPAPTLDELLAGVTPANLHGELDTGAPVGNEAW